KRKMIQSSGSKSSESEQCSHARKQRLLEARTFLLYARGYFVANLFRVCSRCRNASRLTKCKGQLTSRRKADVTPSNEFSVQCPWSAGAGVADRRAQRQPKPNKRNRQQVNESQQPGHIRGNGIETWQLFREGVQRESHIFTRWQNDRRSAGTVEGRSRRGRTLNYRDRKRAD